MEINLAGVRVLVTYPEDYIPSDGEVARLQQHIKDWLEKGTVLVMFGGAKAEVFGLPKLLESVRTVSATYSDFLEKQMADIYEQLGVPKRDLEGTEPLQPKPTDLPRGGFF